MLMIFRAIDGKGGHDGPRRGKKRNEVYIKEIEVPIPTPIWAENARTKSLADLENTAAVEVLWSDPAPSREPPTIPRMVTSHELEEKPTIRCVTNPLAKRRRSIMRPKENEEKNSIEEEYTPAVVQYVSDGYFQDLRSLKRRNEGTSTVFQNSPLAPVTIIITTPEEDDIHSPSPEPEPWNSFNSIRASRTGNPNASTTSLPTTRLSRRFSTDSLPLSQPKRLDPNRLMPPTEHQIDTRRRKAQEFREIRKFLVHFMNAKGDQFPKKLRSRMMEAYDITDSDLSPEVVARFHNQGNGDIKDEGVALEQLGINELDNDTTDAEDLRILSMAFQSRIPVVTPSRQTALVDTTHPNVSMNAVRPRGTSVSKPAPPLPGSNNATVPPTPARSSRPSPPRRTETAPPPPKAEKRMSAAPPRAERKEKKTEDEPLNWLGPLITTSSDSNWRLPLVDDSDSRSRLQKTQSQPNMSRRLTGDSPPPMPGLPNSALAAKGRGRGSGRGESLAGRGEMGVDGMEKAIHVARVRRSGIISGAFGAVREAMGGKKVGVGGEKMRMMREGR
jgi:hypothetical protein